LEPVLYFIYLGFRPDHPKERSGPVVYIYDAMYVNVSTTPVEDPLYRLIPKSKWYISYSIIYMYTVISW
jgi:hypothetical protein